MKRNMLSWVMLVLLMVAAAQSQGFATLITDVTIESVSSEFSNATFRLASAEKLLGSGLDINGSGTHSTVWAGTFTQGDIGTMWANRSNDSQIYIIFDLGQVYDNLHSVKIWNFNRPTCTYSQGVGNIDIKVSATSLPFGDAGWMTDSSVTLTEAPGDDVTPFGDTFLIGSENVRYVLLDIKTKMNGDPAAYLIGLSEVAFYVPEPTTMALFGVGLLGLIRRKKA